MLGRFFRRSPPIELLSPLSCEACFRRLEAAMDGPMSFRRTHAVIGRIRDGRLQASKRIGYRNSFQANLSAVFFEVGGQTRIVCQLGMHPLVTGFMILWCGVLGLASIPVLLSALAEPAMPDAVTFVPVLMLAGGVALVAVGRAMAGGEGQFLIDFVSTTLDARAA